MELREFIKQSLLDIIGGVEDAQQEAPKGTIAPNEITRNMAAVQHRVSHLQPVDFQVAVTVDESAKVGAKIGVLSGIFGASVAGDESEAKQSGTTLKFTIPIHLPLGGSKNS
ncbi:MAG: hypothetical protein AAF226_10500 [Verrucomicrobiota bacterium]